MFNVGMVTGGSLKPREMKSGLAGFIAEKEMAAAAPLLTMLGAETDSAYADTTIKWKDTRHVSQVNAVVSTFGNPTGSRLQLARAGNIQPHDLLRVPATGEIMHVRSVEGNVVTVQRSLGTPTTPPMVASATSQVHLQRMGSAFPEGSGRTLGPQFSSVARDNNNHIIRSGRAITGTAKSIAEKRGAQGFKNLWAEDKRRMMADHIRDIEQVLLMSKRSMTMYGDNPFRTMDGVYNLIKTHIAMPSNGIMYANQLDHFIDRIAVASGAGTLSGHLGIMSSALVTKINQAAADSGRYEFSAGDDYYGLQIKRWNTPTRTLDFIVHPLMDTPGHSGDLLLVEKSSLRLHMLREAEEDNEGIGNNGGRDAAYVGKLTELTLSMINEHHSGLLRGVCQFVIPPRPTMVVVPPNMPTMAAPC